MAEPTFWRTELWHPLSLHFPITLLLLATVVKCVAILLQRDEELFWQKVGSYLLFTGVASVWLAIYTGDLAEGIVARKICDPLLLKRHESASFNTAYLFSAAAAFQFILIFRLLGQMQKIIRLGCVMLLLIGSGYLLYTSHLGAQVVYEQAGGVNVPPSDCAGV